MLRFGSVSRFLASLAAVLMIGSPGRAQELDPHVIYETRCAGCHAPHARELVAERLEMTDGRLVSRKTALPVTDLLQQGHGRLTDGQIGPLIGLLKEIRLSDQTFYRKCATCHVRMRELARTRLTLENGQIVGRYTGTDIAAFMQNHGRLTPEEVPEMLQKMRSHLEGAD